jgi:hypothetical protein
MLTARTQYSSFDVTVDILSMLLVAPAAGAAVTVKFATPITSVGSLLTSTGAAVSFDTQVTATSFLYRFLSCFLFFPFQSCTITTTLNTPPDSQPELKVMYSKLMCR